MRGAQGLYERGYITYMRTDSTTLSETAVIAARSQIEERYGAEFRPPHTCARLAASGSRGLRPLALM